MTRVPRTYFERLYAASDDPFAFRTRWSQTRKYACTMAALPEERYAKGFEAGCSIGILTALLATRCDELMSVDVASEAVRQAREGTAGLKNVTIEKRDLPLEWPEDRFDLVVLSEIAYYFDSRELERFIDRALESLRPGGTLLAVHSRRAREDQILPGDFVHARLVERSRLHRLVQHQEARFLIDIFSHESPVVLS